MHKVVKLACRVKGLIGFFFLNNFVLCSVTKVTGARIGFILQGLCNMGVGILLAFIYGWQLTLLVLAFLPFMAICGAVNWALLSENTISQKAGQEEVGKVGMEFHKDFFLVHCIILHSGPSIAVTGVINWAVMSGNTVSQKAGHEEVGKVRRFEVAHDCFLVNFV